MKKMNNKQAKRASKLAKAENLRKKEQELINKIVNVKNAEGDPDTVAEIVVQNQINFKPKVSVIIPVYNVEPYLRECLDSVVNQSLKEIEIICVDDGSTDKSLDILLEYAKKDKRITVLKQANLHAGVARNAGLAVAKGEYLSFLDSDDFFELNMLEEMYKKAKEDESEIVICGYFLYNQNKGTITPKKLDNYLLTKSPFNPEKMPYFLFFACRMNPWSKLIKHNLFMEHNLVFEKLKLCNDFTCITTAIALAKKISFIDKEFVYYRWNTGSQISTNRFGKNEYWIKAVVALEKNFKRLNIYKKYYPKLRYALSSMLRWETNNKIELLQEEAKKNLSTKLYNDLYLGMNGIPKVSVIIPVYNVEKYLRECLDSVITQTLKDIEIICIDDGSTDNSMQILQKYAKRDTRITIFTQAHKKQGAARNLGISKATGKYVFFLDSDDFIATNTLEKLYNKIEDNQADLCQYLINLYNDKTSKIINLEHKYLNCIQEEINTYTYRYHPQLIFESVEPVLKLYKRDFLLNNNIKFMENCYFEDTIVHIKCMSLANKICCIDEALYFYRINREGQTTGNSENTDKFLDIFNYINEAEKFFKQQNMWNSIKPYYLQFAINRICNYFVRCNKNTKIKFAKQTSLWCNNKNIQNLRHACPEKFSAFLKILQYNKRNLPFYSYLKFPYYLLATPLLRHKKAKLLEKQRIKSQEAAAIKTGRAIPKKVISYKLFNFVPVFSVKQRGGRKIWYLLGIPFWKKRITDNGENTKYYLLGIPLMRVHKESYQLMPPNLLS